MDDIFKFATLVPRVASHTSLPHYLGEVEDIVELSEIKEELIRRVDLVISQVISKYYDQQFESLRTGMNADAKKTTVN